MSDDAVLKQAWEEAPHACSFCSQTGTTGTLVFCAPKAAICEDCTAIIYNKIKRHYRADVLIEPKRH